MHLASWLGRQPERARTSNWPVGGVYYFCYGPASESSHNTAVRLFNASRLYPRTIIAGHLDLQEPLPMLSLPSSNNREKCAIEDRTGDDLPALFRCRCAFRAFVRAQDQLLNQPARTAGYRSTLLVRRLKKIFFQCAQRTSKERPRAFFCFLARNSYSHILRYYTRAFGGGGGG